jgi:hypothetical protein
MKLDSVGKIGIFLDKRKRRMRRRKQQKKTEFAERERTRNAEFAEKTEHAERRSSSFTFPLRLCTFASLRYIPLPCAFPPRYSPDFANAAP